MGLTDGIPPSNIGGVVFFFLLKIVLSHRIFMDSCSRAPLLACFGVIARNFMQNLLNLLSSILSTTLKA